MVCPLEQKVKKMHFKDSLNVSQSAYAYLNKPTAILLTIAVEFNDKKKE